MALIDGEHYPPVVKEALAKIDSSGHEIVAAVFLGGTEKLLEDGDLSNLGYPVVIRESALSAIRQAADIYKPEAVIDLSDEPIVGYRERFEIACLVLSLGLNYLGADFEFRAPTFEAISRKPAMAIIGTGKRVGKTAISAFACRELKKKGFNPGVVAMGRGGPSEPEIIRGDQIQIDAEYLLDQVGQGRHAASDHFEDALMSRVPTVGCRRCGGGLAGQPLISNVKIGAEVANGLDTDFTIFEGSGAAMPPIATETVVMVAGVNQRSDYIIGYLGPYRILISDLVVLTNCEKDVAKTKLEKVLRGIERIKPGIDVVKTVFRPQPLEDISGKRVFFTTTAPEARGPILTDYLESALGSKVVGISHHLSNRARLREDIAAAGEFDILLSELKAAAVDVATAVVSKQNKTVVYCDNAPLTLDGRSLSDCLAGLAKRSIARFRENQVGQEARTK